MIVSEDVTLKLDKPVTNEQIELMLKEKGLEVLRWAITEVDGDLYTIRLSKEI
ncbi:MAG: hypothetical protein II085_04915 [Alphaproteobacteria bacterium]|nr:hypothetical protein [Alphaproteobacteria bacterium]